MVVQININVPSLKTEKEGLAYCDKVAQFLINSEMNDDAHIHRIIYSVQTGRKKS